MSGWVNVPVSDNLALRAVAFWSREGGFVDNVLGPTLMGDATNADIAGEGPELLSSERWSPRGTLDDQPELEACSPRAFISKARRTASGIPTPPSARTRSRASSTIGAMTSGTRLSGTLTGDLGFAELSLTASYFNRKINYEFDNTNYSQWRTRLLRAIQRPPAL